MLASAQPHSAQQHTSLSFSFYKRFAYFFAPSLLSLPHLFILRLDGDFHPDGSDGECLVCEAVRPCLTVLTPRHPGAR